MSASTPADPTYRTYTPCQAAAYAAHRSPYSPALISTVISLHTSSSPTPNPISTTLIDIGCGPGTATRDLAPHFTRVIGLDPGEAMITTARSLGGTTGSGAPIEYAVSAAEHLDSALRGMEVEEGSVDIITAATAAHWFDMPSFWSAAAKMLKKGGSVVLWCSGIFYLDKRVHGEKVAGDVRALLDWFEREHIRPFDVPGSVICRRLYVDLIMPWDVGRERAGELGLECFGKREFVRKTWNERGELEKELEGGWMRSSKETWEETRMSVGTAGAVNRFREANKERLESGEIEDCVDVLVRNLKAIMGEGVEVVEGGLDTAVLMIKKRR